MPLLPLTNIEFFKPLDFEVPWERVYLFGHHYVIGIQHNMHCNTDEIKKINDGVFAVAEEK